MTKAELAGYDVNDNLDLWVTDGTATGTSELTIAEAFSSGLLGPAKRNFTVLDSKMLFAGVDTSDGVDLRATDGTSASTSEPTVGGAGLAGLSPLELTIFPGPPPPVLNGAGNRVAGSLLAGDVLAATTRPAAITTSDNAATSVAGASGELTNIGQHDWIAVSLVGGQSYEITITGLSQYAQIELGTASGLAGDGTGAFAAPNTTVGLGSATTQNMYFMPSASGIYYLDLSDSYGLVPESYTVSVVATTADYTDNPTDPGSLAVGGSAAGKLTNIGQHDWIAVSLIANQAYEFTITGLSQYAQIELGTAAGLAADGTGPLRCRAPMPGQALRRRRTCISCRRRAGLITSTCPTAMARRRRAIPSMS